MNFLRISAMALGVGILALIAYQVHHDLYYSETYCPERVRRDLGNRALRRVPASEHERRNVQSAVGADGRIYLSVRMELQCESTNHALLGY
jgi:hypothetical protein